MNLLDSDKLIIPYYNPFSAKGGKRRTRKIRKTRRNKKNKSRTRRNYH